MKSDAESGPELAQLINQDRAVTKAMGSRSLVSLILRHFALFWILGVDLEDENWM